MCLGLSVIMNNVFADSQASITLCNTDITAFLKNNESVVSDMWSLDCITRFLEQQVRNSWINAIETANVWIFAICKQQRVCQISKAIYYAGTVVHISQNRSLILTEQNLASENTTRMYKHGQKHTNPICTIIYTMSYVCLWHSEYMRDIWLGYLV